MTQYCCSLGRSNPRPPAVRLNATVITVSRHNEGFERRLGSNFTAKILAYKNVVLLSHQSMYVSSLEH